MRKNRFSDWFKYVPFAVLPFVYLKSLIDPGQLAQIAFLLVYLLVMLVWILFSGKGTNKTAIVWNKSFSYLLIFLGLSIIQVVSAFLVEEALFSWIKMAVFLLLMVVVFQDESRITLLERMAKVFTVTTTALFVLVLWQISQLNMLEYDHQMSYRLNATLGHRNLLSQYILLLLPFNFLVRNDGHAWFRWSSRVQLVLSVLLLLILFSRAVWVAFFIALSGTILIALFIKKRINIEIISFKRLRSFSLITVGLLTILMFAHPTIRSVLFTQSVTTVNTGYGTAKDRLILWEKTWNMFREHPGKGIGPGQWKIHFLKSGVEGTLGEDGKTFYQRPHNDFLWVLSEYGFFVFILYALFWLMLLRSAWRKVNNRDDAHQRTVGVFATFFLLSYGFVSMFSFPMERIPHLTLFAVVGALVLEPKNIQMPRWRKKIFITCAICIVLGGIIFSSLRMYSDAHLKKALDAKVSDDWNSVAMYAAAANAPWYRIDATSTPCKWYEGMASYFKKDIPKARDLFKQANRVNPYHMHVLNNLATCYNELDSTERSVELYKKALRINPAFADARYNLAIVLFQQGQILPADSNIRYLVDRKLYESKMDALVVAIADFQVREIAKHSRDPLEIEVMSRILNDVNWMRDLYIKAVNNGILFERQLMLDVRYVIDNDNHVL